MAFDIEGARKAGYSDTEIADYLGQENGFDTAAALKSGYTPDEIIGHLTSAPQATKPAEPEKSFLSTVGESAASLAKGVAATNPVIGRALSIAQGPKPEKIGSVLEGQQMPGVPFDAAEAERLSRRDYAEAAEMKERQAKSPSATELRAPILSDRQRFAEQNPVTAGFAQSAAQTLAGTLNVPSVAAGLAGETINRQAEAMGIEAPAGRVPNMPLVNDLKAVGQEYASQLSRKDPGKAWDDGDFGRWLMTQLSGNSFSAAQSLGALFVPGAQASLLASMGGIAAGGAYAEGDSASAATMKGLVEAGSEMLPLKAAEGIKDLVLAIPAPARNRVLAEAGKRLLASGTAVTTNSLVGAIEESAAEIGSNIIDKYVSGKDKSIFEDVDRAAIVGAAFGTGFSAPAIAETMSTPQGRAARELARELQAPQLPSVETTVEEALRTSGANIDPVATTLSAAAARRVEHEQAVADIGRAQSVDQAIAAAERAVSIPVESTEAIAQRIREIEQQQESPVEMPQVAESAVSDIEMTRDGTLRVIGDTQALTQQLRDSGVTNFIPTASGVIVGQTQAAEAQTVLQGAVNGNLRDGGMESPALARNAGAGQQAGGATNAVSAPLATGGNTGATVPAVPQAVVSPSEPTNAQSALAQPLSPELARKYSQPSTRQQTVASQLQARVQATYPDATFQAVGVPAGRAGKSMAEAADTAKRLFGIDVNYVQFSGSPLFDGVRSDAFPNTIFIRADAPKPHMAILGHELLHEMRGTSPELYGELSAALDALVKNDTQYADVLRRRYESQGGKLPAEWREELHADIVGDNFADPQFWADLSREKPGMFERLANAVRQFLNRILLKAKPFGSDAYLKDIKAARDVVSSAVQKFSDSRVRDTAFSVDSTQAQAQNEAYAGNITTPRAGERAVDTDGYRPASTVHQQLADQLLSRVQRAYPNAKFHAVDAPEGVRGQPLIAARTAGKRLFRQDVVFVQFDGAPLFNGAVSDAIPGVVFVRVDTDKPHMSVLGHELLHQLRKETPDLYDQLASRLGKMVENESAYAAQLASRYEKQGGQLPKEWREELYADIVGDNFSNPDFWEAMAKDQPGLFQRVAEAIRKFLDNVLTRAEPFATGQYLRDVKAARDAVVDAMRQFSGTQVGALTSQVDGVAMSVASQEAQTLKDVVREIESTGIRMDAFESRGRINLNRIVVPQEARNSGAGTKAMNDLVKYADASVQTIALTPSSDFGGNKNRLVDFYKRFGFVENKGRNKDFEISESMYRLPQTKMSFASQTETSQRFSEDNRLSNLNPNGSAWQRIRENNPVLRGKGPDDTVTVYRATIGDAIRPDDFVAVDKSTLRTELRNVRERDGDAAKIIQQDVRVRDLLMGNDATEFVYFPESQTSSPDIRYSLADDYGLDENTGLPLNADGTVTVYHHTNKTNADRIRKTGVLKAAAEPDVYVTTRSQTDTGYGDTAVAINVDPDRLMIDDEFPDGRIDYRMSVGRPGGSVRVKFPEFVPAGDIRYSLSQPQDWAIPDVSRIDRIIYELQDQKVDLKRAQEAIKEAGRQIEERFDARMAESLYPGRVAYRSEQFLKGEVQPLLQAMALNQVGMNELADYLHARGAEERNAQIARINPDMPDGGAGTNTQGVLMTNQAAQDYLNAIPADRRKQLDSLASKIDAITKGTRELLVREGLEKPEVIQAWEAAYKNYVPMFRDEAESGNPHPSGGGFSVRGGNSQRATGSTKAVTNILAHVLMQREAAITKAEKNRVGLALYGLALSNPNPEFWATIRPGMQAAQIAADLQAMGVDPVVAEAGMQGVPTVRTVDPILNKVVDRPNPMYKSLPGAITLKIGGEDRVLMLNEKEPRALRMAEALKNLDGLTRFDLAGSIIGRTTRWMASVNTQYNPAFGIVNGIRDTFGGAVNLTSTPLRGKSTQVLLDAYTKAGPAIAKEIAKPGGQSEWAKLYRQFQEDGGKTGYREMFKDANDRSKAIENELKLLEKAGKLTPGKAASTMLNLLDGFNTTIENAVRLSAYKNALDQGLSRPAAAKIARELTVDFNRKGRAGRELGPLYAFFNASVQGAARTIEAIKGPAGAKIITGGLVLGALQPLLLAMAGIDDDEIPEFVKTRALIIPLFNKNKEFVAIPMPLGLHVIPNTGRVIAELALNGGKDIRKKSVDAIGEIAGAFNPLGGGNVFTADGALRTVAPTVVDPIIEIGFNKNFAGNQIERGERGETDVRPGFARARESTQRSLTGQAYLGISKAINKLSGGSDYEAGMVSPSPERIQYLAQVAGGGVLRELEKIINVSDAASKGDEVKRNKFPIIGRLYGEVDEDAVAKSRYFEASKKFDKAQAAYKAAAKAGDATEVRRMLETVPELQLGRTQDDIAKKIAALNKQAVMTINDREQLKIVDEARLIYMRDLNEAIKRQEEQSGKTTPGQKLREIIKSKREGATSAAQ